MRTCAARDCSDPVIGGSAKRFCRGGCRLREHRAEVREGKRAIPHRLPPGAEHGARVRSVPIDRPARFAYADPAYPGKAHLYPENTEIDHLELIAELVADYPDGWALSTGSDTLAEVLALCPCGVRVGSWHRQHRPYLERPKAWEPVIFCGGRRVAGCVPDAVVAAVPGGWELPGRKPPAFYRWVFAFLGVLPGDELVEPFPGSGTGIDELEKWLGRGNVSPAVKRSSRSSRYRHEWTAYSEPPRQSHSAIRVFREHAELYSASIAVPPTGFGQTPAFALRWFAVRLRELADQVEGHAAAELEHDGGERP